MTGTGETAALAAMDYCRQIARGAYRAESGDTPAVRERAEE